MLALELIKDQLNKAGLEYDQIILGIITPAPPMKEGDEPGSFFSMDYDPNDPVGACLAFHTFAERMAEALADIAVKMSEKVQEQRDKDEAMIKAIRDAARYN